MSSAVISHSISPRKLAESRVMKIAGYLRVGTWILLSVTILLILCAAVALFWSPTVPNGSPLLQRLVPDGGARIPLQFEVGGYSLQSKLLIAGYLALIGLFLTYCFTRLHILFDNFRNSQIFIKQNSELLRGLGYALVVGFFLGGFLKFGFLVSMAALDTMGQSFGNFPNLKLTIGTGDIRSVVAIGMIFLSAWILEIGRDLCSETELTI